MKFLIFGLTSLAVISASPVYAVSCDELRSKLSNIDKKIAFADRLISADAFDSEDADLHLELGKRAAREYIDVARVFISKKCADSGRVASSVRIFTTMLNGMR